MDTKKAWEDYHTPGVGPQSDEELLEMLRELTTAIHSVERIYGHVRAQLMVRAMILDFQALNNMAWARGLKDIPSL